LTRPSIWRTIRLRRASFVNPRFEEWPLSRGPLLPACGVQRLTVWPRLLPPLQLAANQTLQEVGWLQAWEECDELRDESFCRARVTKTSRQIDRTKNTEFTLYHIQVEVMSHDEFLVAMEEGEVRWEGED
ncbi:MAG: hypothetical protein SGPRY_010592, partial [Prymnesium sp.]